MERSVFGLVAYQVAQRPQEFGVHLALGSEAPGLLRLGLGQAGRRTCAGLVLGAGVSVASGRLLASQMFGVSPHDPGLLFMAGGLQLAVALVASFAPARRASRLHPMEALRHE